MDTTRYKLLSISLFVEQTGSLVQYYMRSEATERAPSGSVWRLVYVR